MYNLTVFGANKNEIVPPSTNAVYYRRLGANGSNENEAFVDGVEIKEALEDRRGVFKSFFRRSLVILRKMRFHSPGWVVLLNPPRETMSLRPRECSCGLRKSFLHLPPLL